MSDRPKDELHEQVDAVVNSGVLGKSDAYPRLLRYLADRPAGRPLKEIEIAIDVFGRDESFDVTQDSLVRVYIHKLRQRLDQYYQGPGQEAPMRLEIPKGSYQLTTAKQQASTAAGMAALSRGPGKWLLAGLALGLLVAFAANFAAQHRAQTHLPMAQQPWQPLLQSDKDLIVVVGTYFFYSELNQNFEQLREIRNFSINNPAQFQRFVAESDENAAQYRDLGTRYLPAGSAAALASLIPLLQGQVNWQLATAEQLTEQQRQSHNLLYLGPYSGLGDLASLVFEHSSFALHPNGLVLIDSIQGEVFANEGQLAEGYRDRYVDFGLFTRSQLPTGNWLYSLMSARDAGLQHTTELMVSAHTLQTLQPELRGLQQSNLEILTEVSGTAASELQPQVRLVRPVRDE